MQMKLAASSICFLGFLLGFDPGAAAQATDPYQGLFVKSADIALGDRTSRFDYESLDPETGRLFIAKMGAGQLVVFDVRSATVIAQLDGFPKVTGVLAVPSLHRVYASAPGAGIGASLGVALGMAGLSSGGGAIVAVDSLSLKQLARIPAGVFPDGIAYDPDDRRIFVSDELGGAVTAIDAESGKVLARIAAGGETGNVQYDPLTRKIYVPIQSRNELATIDPRMLRVTGRVPLAGANHPHGLHLAAAAAIGYVACDENDRLLVVDLKSGKVLQTLPLGHDPDVLAADPGFNRLYVASESGMLSVFDTADPAGLKKLGDVFAGTNAHSVAVDPASHRLYLPLPDLDAKAVMRVLTPVR